MHAVLLKIPINNLLDSVYFGAGFHWSNDMIHFNISMYTINGEIWDHVNSSLNVTKISGLKDDLIWVNRKYNNTIIFDEALCY